MNTTEQQLFLEYLNQTLFSSIGVEKFTVSKVTSINEEEATSSIIVMPTIFGPYFYRREIKYSRLKLEDILLKPDDTYLEVPFNRAKTKNELINYMNEIYLFSVNREVSIGTKSLLSDCGIELTQESLNNFNLDNPPVGSSLTIHSKTNSYVFEGSLLIVFV